MDIIGEFKTSVYRALEEIDSKYESYPGLVVCGTHKPELYNIEAVIREIQHARENNIPSLLICFGYQLGAIEYARNVLGIQDATSEEFGSGTFVVKKRNNLNVGLKNGESYWNNYEVDSEILKKWEIPQHFFVTQSHPEYQSMKGNPHPLIKSFINLCKSV